LRAAFSGRSQQSLVSSDLQALNDDLVNQVDCGRHATADIGFSIRRLARCCRHGNVDDVATALVMVVAKVDPSTPMLPVELAVIESEQLPAPRQVCERSSSSLDPVWDEHRRAGRPSGERPPDGAVT